MQLSPSPLRPFFNHCGARGASRGPVPSTLSTPRFTETEITIHGDANPGEGRAEFTKKEPKYVFVLFRGVGATLDTQRLHFTSITKARINVITVWFSNANSEAPEQSIIFKFAIRVNKSVSKIGGRPRKRNKPRASRFGQRKLHRLVDPSSVALSDASRSSRVRKRSETVYQWVSERVGKVSNSGCSNHPRGGNKCPSRDLFGWKRARECMQTSLP